MLNNGLTETQVIQPRPGQTLGQVVDESEATLFVGREAELQALQGAVERARSKPVALYLHGPAGVGKSALLRVFARWLRTRGTSAVVLDASAMSRTPEQVEQSLARQLDLAEGAMGGSPATIAAINERAARDGMVIMVDAYDDLADQDTWLRAQVFRQLGTGVCLILAGRQRAAQLWSRDLGWTRALIELSLGDLSEAEVAEFLRRCGIAEEAVWAEAYSITGGRPQLLGLAANALLLQPEAGANGKSGRDAERLALFLVEHILHPGSRRRSWRAGAGSSELDGAVAAAAVLPVFDRGELAAVVGQAAVDGAWPTLLGLSTLGSDGRSYRLPPALRRRLAGAVAHQRPWAERQWRRTSIEYRIRSLREGRGTDEDRGAAWHQVSRLARESAWWSHLNPAPVLDGMVRVHRVGAEAAPSSLGELAAGSPLDLPSVLRMHPEGSIAAVDAKGRPVGYLAVAALGPGTYETLLAQPGLGAWLGELPAGERDRLTAEGALLWCEAAAAVPGAFGALVREACGAFGRHGRVVAVCPTNWRVPATEDPLLVLESIGFEVARAACDPVCILDLERTGYADWLSRVSEPRLDLVPPARQWAASAKEALQALHDPGELARTAAARYYVAMYGDRRPSAVRAWVLDALASASLGDAPPSGRVLLTLYYIERIGPHEAVAERMNLPRTTYFRCHRQAVSDLGASLFG